MRDDPAADPRLHAQRALGEGDATTALDWIDALPEAERPGWLAEVWMLVGAPRSVAHALGLGLSPDLEARARAFIADPPRRELPSSDAADPYADLTARAERLAALSRAAELAMMHLASSEVAPRVDWRVAHIEHAASLAMSLGDPRLSALVRAFEARLEADLGERDDALEAARDAIARGTAADEPRATQLGEAVLVRLSESADALASPADDEPEGT